MNQSKSFKRKADNVMAAQRTSQPKPASTATPSAETGRPVTRSRRPVLSKEAQTQQKLENIYADLDRLWKKIRGHEDSVCWAELDPFRDVYGWKQETRDRFRDVNALLGREYAVVAM